MIIIPIICGLLFWLGGREQMNVPFNQKLFRWVGLGIFASIIGLFHGHLLSLFCLLTYFISTNVFGYGETHVMRKLLGRDWQWICYGFFFGLSSFPCLSWLSFLQAFISSISVYWLMRFSNDGIGEFKLNQQIVEFGIGFIGTICYLWIK